jgi:hypothetical protein
MLRSAAAPQLWHKRSGQILKAFIFYQLMGLS